MKLRKTKKGFTIVELVIVIGVIGILSAILIPTFVNVTNKANIAAMKSNCASAYSSYVSEAGDGIVDGSDPELAIVLAKQEDVVLSKGTSYFYFNEEWKEVKVEPTKTNYTLKYVVDEDAAHSEFNGYTFRYFKANE